jgi:hypothetical protein
VGGEKADSILNENAAGSFYHIVGSEYFLKRRRVK